VASPPACVSEFLDLGGEVPPQQGFAPRLMTVALATKLRRKPLKEEIYDVLHARILGGEYAAGTWLRQEEIASQLGVSMTPVREALDLLVSSGLAERVPYRGVRIRNPSGSDILDSYSVRLLLECSAADAAADIVTYEEIERFREILERARKLIEVKDLPEERLLSRRLHTGIVAASGNRLLYSTYLMVLNRFPDWMLYQHLYRKPELVAASMRTELQEHGLIVEALADHDRGLAVRRTAEHMMSRGNELVNFLNVPKESLRDREAQVLRIFEGTFSNLTN
jgi:DNA-binding GntR family transcriptional regulator